MMTQPQSTQATHSGVQNSEHAQSNDSFVVGSGILAQGAWRLSAADSQAATRDSAALSQVQMGTSRGA